MHYLKKKHSSGYYTQIQIAFGLARAEWCDVNVIPPDGAMPTKPLHVT